MSEYKIFEVDEMFWVLTTTPEKAIEICIDDGCIDEEDAENCNVEECNYNDITYQPLSTLKNIFSKEELREIEDILKNEKYRHVVEKNGIKYDFEDNNDFDYIAVVLTFEQILNTPEILKEFDFDTVISTTEW